MKIDRRLEPAPDRLLDLREVIALVGLGKTRIYALVRSGSFPAQCKPGGGASRWSEREVQAWIATQLASRAAA